MRNDTRFRFLRVKSEETADRDRNVSLRFTLTAVSFSGFRLPGDDLAYPFE